MLMTNKERKISYITLAIFSIIIIVCNFILKGC